MENNCGNEEFTEGYWNRGSDLGHLLNIYEVQRGRKKPSNNNNNKQFYLR